MTVVVCGHKRCTTDLRDNEEPSNTEALSVPASTKLSTLSRFIVVNSVFSVGVVHDRKMNLDEAQNDALVAAAREEQVTSATSSIADVATVSDTTLKRSSLSPTMPPDRFEEVVKVTLGLLEARFQKMLTITDVANKDVNLNPFLMLAMAPAYNIFSPFEAAEYVQNSKMPHGDSTAFGKFVEAKIFPIFSVSEPPEKRQSSEIYSSIDAELTIDGQRYLATWKSGPWTMNQSHAHEMVRNFPKIHEATNTPIILGIFYGTVGRLNNKPAMVRRGTGEYFHVLVGKDLWEFVTGVENAHLEILRAIRQAQTRFAIAHGGKTFHEHMIESRLKLAESFRKAFNLVGEDDDMWELIFKKSF